MKELITLIVLVWFLCALLKARRREKKEKREKTCEKIRFSFIYPDIKRSIDESIEIINKTKDIEAGIKAFAVIKSNVSRLAAESPSPLKITLETGGKERGKEIEIGAGDAAESLSKFEKEWMLNFFSETIDTLMKQSEEAFDPVLRIDLMREAVKTAYKGLEYLPDDGALKSKGDLAERRLGFLTGARKG